MPEDRVRQWQRDTAVALFKRPWGSPPPEFIEVDADTHGLLSRALQADVRVLGNDLMFRDAELVFRGVPLRKGA